MAERAGDVTEITQPAAGKKSGSAKIGGRKIWFFWREYNSEEPSLIRSFLEDAERSKVRVVVSGEERQSQNEHGAYTSFTAKDVRAAPQEPISENGSKGPSEAPGGKRFVGREPGTADFFLAMRWAYSLAADLLPRTTGETPKVEDISRLAGELFSACWVDALTHKERLQTPEEADEWS